MVNNLEDIIKLSHQARLIPVVADSKKEERATSIFLPAFLVVPPFAHNILAVTGARIGTCNDFPVLLKQQLLGKY